MAMSMQKDMLVPGGSLRAGQPAFGPKDAKCRKTGMNRTRIGPALSGRIPGTLSGAAPGYPTILFSTPGSLRGPTRHDNLNTAFFSKVSSFPARPNQDFLAGNLLAHDSLVARGAAGTSLGSSDNAGSDGEGGFDGERSSITPSLSPASTSRGTPSLSPSASPTRRRPPASKAYRARSGTRSFSKISALAQATDWAVIEQETSRFPPSSRWNGETLSNSLVASRLKQEQGGAETPIEALNCIKPSGNPAIDLTVYNKALRLQVDAAPARAGRHGVTQEQVKEFQQRKLETCVELLEGLHRTGHLNMDQVYHRRFFDECKSAGDVSSAFRFLELILAASPSLSTPTLDEDEAQVSEFEAREKARQEKERQRSLLQTFNLVLAVCAHCADAQGALKAFRMAKQIGVTLDTALYTTLISALCRASQLDLAFKFFYEMEGSGAKPNSHTVCALIDGCGKAKMIAKAFGVYGLMMSKGVRPDRAVYNSLITACVRAGATERAFDILEDMRQEKPPVVADCATAGALLSAAFANPQQRERALEVYREQLQLALQPGKQQIVPGSYVPAKDREKTSRVGEGVGGGRHSPVRMFTAAVHACSSSGDWDQALRIWGEFKSLPRHQVKPDEIFTSAMLDVARHAGKPGEAEALVEEMQLQWGVPVGAAITSALMSLYAEMGLKDNAMDLFEKMKHEVALSSPAFNSLISLLCAHGAVEDALAVAAEMKRVCGGPDNSTYSLLLEACLRSETTPHPHGEGTQGWAGVDEGTGAQLALKLYQLARQDEVRISLKLCELMLDLCAVMVAKGAPPPPQDLLTSLRQGSQSISGERTQSRRRQVPAPLGPQARARGRVGNGPRSLWGRTGAQSPYGTEEQSPPWGMGMYRGAHDSASMYDHVEEKESGGVEFEYTEREYETHQAQHQFTYRPTARPGAHQREQQHQATIGSALFPITGWRHLALVVYEHSISSGVVPTLTALSKILSLLQHRPASSSTSNANATEVEGSDLQDAVLVSQQQDAVADKPAQTLKAGVLGTNKNLLYHPLAFAIYKEAEALGAVPEVSSTIGPLTLRLETFPASLAEVCLLSVLRTVEMRLRSAPGLKLFPLSLHLPVNSVDLILARPHPPLAPQEPTPEENTIKARRRRRGKNGGEEEERVVKPPTPIRPIHVASKTGQAVGSLLRRLDLRYMGYETEGTVHITANSLTTWLRLQQTKA